MKLQQIIIKFIIFFTIFDDVNGLNYFSQVELITNGTISCIKYILGRNILAVALNTTGIDLYNISGTNVTFLRTINTSTRVNSMLTGVNNSRLIYAEDYTISVIDFNMNNQTYSTQLKDKIDKFYPNGTSIILQT